MTKQVDLFLDQILDAPIKDERALMEHPWFALAKRPRMEPFVYDDGRVKIRIDPGPKGTASIWDKDILIYLASVINDRIERDMPVDRTITFPAYDFLTVTGRGTGKRAYELFLDALFRLRSTTITTTIAAGGDTERRGFGWIESWRIVERTNSTGKRVMAAVEVTLCDWMFRAIVQDRRVLSINRDYFRLTMGLERRLYELARKHCGHQPEWFIGLARLAEKCGTTRQVKKFKADLVRIIERDRIPDYQLVLVDSGQTPFQTADGRPLVRITPRKAPPDQAVLDTPPRLSIATYETARERWPGYDIDFLERRWQAWTTAKGGKLRNPDKAFLAWAETYTRNNPI